MIEVKVAEKNEVDIVDVGLGRAAPSSKMCYSICQQWICQDPVVTEIDQRRFVTGQGDLHQRIDSGSGAAADGVGTVHGGGAPSAAASANHPLKRWCTVAAPTIGSSGNSNVDG